MRVLLVPVADRPECVHALNAAFRLASLQEANVVGCHVRAHRTDDAKFNSAAARRLFGRVAESNGFRVCKRPRLGKSGLAFWHEMLGSPDKVFAIVGPVADLVVLSRPAIGRSGPARDFLMAALLNTARPLLVLPQKSVPRLDRRILIAWSQRPETALAVTAALPLLQKAAQVAILASGPENHPGPKAAQLADYLTQHRVRSKILRTPGRNVRAEIAKSFVTSQSTLLIMGAYSHRRLRQRIFGGVTETVLFKSELPALVQHL